MLTAFYDLALSPAKYDFIGFVMDAERHRRLTGEDGIRFVFVPGDNGGFRVDKLPPQDLSLRRKMFNNILLPMCCMLGVPTEIVLCSERVDARKYQTGEVFPTEYLVEQPAAHYGMHVIVRGFKRGMFPLKASEPIDDMPEVVTITLRESHYWPTRNGNREVWLAAAQKIKDAGLQVVFIPDVDSPEIEGWYSDHESSLNLHRRAAIYESAKHNFFVSNGPAWMAAAMAKPNCTIFKLVAEGAVCCSAGYYELIGFPVGSQIGRPNHKIIWEDDTIESVLPAVEEVINA